MAIYVANNGSLQTIKGIYYAMTEDYINATLFHNLVPKTATEIKFLYASDNPDLTGYQRIGYCDNNNNFIEVWNNGTKYILINPRKNYIYAPVSCSYFLSRYDKLATCIFDNFNTEKVTMMNGLFNNCSSLTTLDISNFKTDNVKNIYDMFNNCSNLISFDISNFKTENVTSMGYMFNNCSNLTALDISNFKTDNVENMDHMFNNCNSLTSIISHTFNTASVGNSTYMFRQCYKLVGGNGTTYNSSHTNSEYARVDGENGLAGYFTAPTN